MSQRRRCSFCRFWFHPHPWLKRRQKTCCRPAAGSKRGSPISNGGPKVRITFTVLMRCKRKSTEHAPITSAAAGSSIRTTCGATRLSSETGAIGERKSQKL
jgi:hypothetical protein